MGKMKTHKGSKKRFKKTSKGKFKRKRAFGSHLKTKKSGDRTRKLKRSGLVHKNDQKRVEEALPYE